MPNSEYDHCSKMIKCPLNLPKGDFRKFNYQKFKLNFLPKTFNILILLLILNFNSFPQTEVQNMQTGIQDLVSGINQIVNDPFFEQTTIAINIFDLTDSIKLYSKNEKLLLVFRHPIMDCQLHAVYY